MSSSAYTVAVVGAGAVGQEMIRVLRQRRFPVREVRVLARTPRPMVVDDETYQVRTTTPEAFEGVQIALFAGTEGEKGAAVTFGEDAIKCGAVVIDNGKDFRLDPRVPLVVPEVNGDDVREHHGLIANPNCSTIQMVHALKPLHDLAGLRRVVVSTYQAASGAGASGVTELEEQLKALASGEAVPEAKVHAAQLAGNVIPQIGSFRADGYTDEEWKLVVETRKIMHLPDLPVAPTVVRVPVVTGHSESVWVETERRITADEARGALRAFPGIRLLDDLVGNGQDDHRRTWPTPLEAYGSDDTFVGRVREDPFVPNALLMWVVADNLRKGAASNAVQIAERLVADGLL
jgi:aspartate-semialdehyde dehydrogenase